MPTFNYERASSALVESAYYGDPYAAKRFGVSTRSIVRWRNRMDTDDDLAALVVIKKEQFAKSWSDELPAAIRASIRALKDAALKLEMTDTASVKVIADSLHRLTEIAMTKDVLDARLNEYQED